MLCYRPAVTQLGDAVQCLEHETDIVFFRVRYELNQYVQIGLLLLDLCLDLCDCFNVCIQTLLNLG